MTRSARLKVLEGDTLVYGELNDAQRWRARVNGVWNKANRSYREAPDISGSVGEISHQAGDTAIAPAAISHSGFKSVRIATPRRRRRARSATRLPHGAEQQPAARQHEAERHRREAAAEGERERRVGVLRVQEARDEREGVAGIEDAERRGERAGPPRACRPRSVTQSAFGPGAACASA